MKLNCILIMALLGSSLGCVPGSKHVDIDFSGQILTAQQKPAANKELKIILERGVGRSDFDKSISKSSPNDIVLTLKTDQAGKFQGKTSYVQHVGCFLFSLDSCGPKETPLPFFVVSTNGTCNKKYVVGFDDGKIDFRIQNPQTDKLMVPTDKGEVSGSAMRPDKNRISIKLDMTPKEDEFCSAP